MSVIRAIPKQIFDFSGLSAGSTAIIVGAKGIDVSQYREANVLVRLHSGQSTPVFPPGASVVVSARADAPTTEDPADFLVVPATDLNSVSFSNSDTAPSLKLFTLQPSANTTQVFGGWLRIYVKGVNSASAGTFQAMLSVDVVPKS